MSRNILAASSFAASYEQTRKTHTWNGRKIAILIAPRGPEEPEFKQPKDAVEAAGAAVTVIGIEPGEAKTNNNDLDVGGSYQVDRAVSEVRGQARSA